MERTNANYTIIASAPLWAGKEVVIGHNPKAPEPWVSWFCTNGDSYDIGRYFSDYASAAKNFAGRIAAAFEN